MATRDEMFKSFDNDFGNIPALGQNNYAMAAPSEEEWNRFLVENGMANNAMQGIPGQQEQPGFLNSFLRGAAAQGFGTLGGQADFLAGLTGSETLRSLGDSAQNTMQEYSRPHEYTASEIFGNGLSGVWKYLSDPNGAAYDVGGGFGSTAAMAAEAAILSAALPAGATAAGTGALAALATRLGLKSVAGALTKGGPAAALIKNVIASTPLEAASESGGTYREMTTDESGKRLNLEDIDMDKVQEAMAKNFVGNLGVLGASNLLESVGIGRLLGDNMRKGILGKVRNIGEFLATNAGQNAWEEGAQTGTNLYAQGQINNIGQIVNPLEWNEEQLNAAAIGGVAGLGQGGLMGGAGYVGNRMFRNTAQQNTEQPVTEEQPAEQQAQFIQPKIANAVTNKQFGDAVNIAMNDQSTNPVDRMRNLQGHITYNAEDGTNCARTVGLALVGTDYQDLINVDNFVATAKEKGQLIEDTANYVPQPGDLAVVNDGNHIVMVSDNGGTIQNGESGNGVYESKLSPAQMFGDVKYYIRTSDLYAGQQQQAVQEQAEEQQQVSPEQQMADEVQRRKDAIRDVLDKKSAEQRAEQEAADAAAQAQQQLPEEEIPAEQQPAPAIQPIRRWQDIFTQEEIAGLNRHQKKALKNALYRFKKKHLSRTLAETRDYMRNFYNERLLSTTTAPQTQQAAVVQQQNPVVQQPVAQQGQPVAPVVAQDMEPQEEATVLDMSNIPAVAKGGNVNDVQTELPQPTTGKSGNQNSNTEPRQAQPKESQNSQSPESQKAEVSEPAKAQERARLVKLATRPASRIVNQYRKRVAGLPQTKFDKETAAEEAIRKAQRQAAEAKRLLGAAVRTNQATPEEARNAAAAIDKAVEIQTKNIGKTRQERVANAKPGKTVTVRTDDGTKFNVRYKVVSANDIVASNMADGSFAKNPEYPQRLQPRNRQSAVSQTTANKIAAALDPELLAENTVANMGAPIIDKDGNVENGNLRMIGIMLAHAKETEGVRAYEQYLAENAERFGLTRADVEGIDKPVLVRERVDDADGLLEKIIGSTSGGQNLSATEQAKQDAKALTDSTLNKIDVKANGDLNQEFIAAAINDIAKLSPNVENEMRDENGNVSQMGLLRIKNALFAKAYGNDPRLLKLVAESTDNDIKSITSAMLNVAPKVAKLKSLMDSGKLLKADFTKPIIESAEATDHMRQTGKSLERILQEGPGMFENMAGDMLPLSQGAKDMLGQLSGSKGSVVGITRVFNEYLRSVEKQNNNEENIIGAEEVKTTDPDELVKHWIEGTKGNDLFAAPAKEEEKPAPEPVKEEPKAEEKKEEETEEDRIKREGKELLTPEVQQWIDKHPPEYNKNLSDEENNIVCRKLGEEFEKVAGVKDSTAYDSEERIRLQTNIAEYLYNVDIENRKRERKATLVIGLSASGKSTVSDELRKENGGYLLVDADEAKKLLPEFDNGLLAGFVHEESSAIIKDAVLAKAIENGDNICWPLVGGGTGLFKKIHQLQKAGYDVKVSLTHVPIEEAKRRVIQRFIKDGRFVDTAIIDKNVLKNPANYVTITWEDTETGEKTQESFQLEIPEKAIKENGAKIDTDIIVNYAILRHLQGEGVNELEWLNNNVGFGTEIRERRQEQERWPASSERRFDGRIISSIRLDYRGGQSEESGEVRPTEPTDQVNRTDTENQGGSSISTFNPNGLSREQLFANMLKGTGVEAKAKTDVKSAFGIDNDNKKMPGIINKNALKSKNAASAINSVFNSKESKQEQDFTQTATSENTVAGIDVSQDHLEELQKRARKKLFGQLSSNPMFDPELWSLGCEIGAIYLARGARTLKAWTSEMVKGVGEKIRPWLGALWQTLNSIGNTKIDPELMTNVFNTVGAIQEMSPGISEAEFYKELAKYVGSETQVRRFRPYIKAAFAGMAEYNDPGKVTQYINKVLDGEKGAAENGRLSIESNGQGEGQTGGSNGIPENAASGTVGRRNSANDRTAAETAERVDNESNKGEAEVRNETRPGRTGRHSEQLGGNASEDVQTANGRGPVNGDSGSVVSPVGEQNVGTVGTERETPDGSAGLPAGSGQSGQNDTSVPGIRNGRAGNAERGRGIVSEDGTYEILPSGDYHIIDAERNEIGGNRAKEIFKENMLAFETMKRIQEGEDVEFTPETMNALARYTGWGRFRNQLFGGEYDSMKPQEGWEQEAQMVHDAMTKEEWENVRDSTDTAFYTPYSVTTAMWNLAQQLGLKHGNILEPSMGVGGFFATMPKEIYENSTITGIEIEPTSGEIAKNLYPSAHVFVQGYEDFIKPNNSYDFIISNVPYASISMEDTEEAKQFSNPKSILIHDFFFLRGLNQLRPGGIMMALTSTGTMDKQDSQVRIAMAQKAELVGAIRLPNKTFKQSGGTDVACDLLVFKKREKPISYIEASREPWINTKVIDESSAGKVVKINDYFANNEQNIIGVAEVGSGKFGPTLNVNFSGSTDEIAERLNDCIKENFPKDIMGKTLTKEESEFKSADLSHPNHTFYMKNGELMYRLYDEEVNLVKSGTIKSNKKPPKSLDKIGNKTFYQNFIASHPEFKELAIPEGQGKWEDKVKQLAKLHPELAAKAVEVAYNDIVQQDVAEKERELHEQVAPLIQLNEKYQELLTAETKNEPDEVVEKLRKETRELFDKALKANGGRLTWKTETKGKKKPKTNYANGVNVIKKAGDYNAAWNVAALDKGDGEPADILKKRILRGVVKNENPTVKEALKSQIENGAAEIDLNRIAKETKTDKDKVLQQLIKDNAVYETPEGTVVPTNIYLSGNVREKLKQAQAMAQKDDRFKRNVDALMKVQPEQVTSSEITANIGANWISADSYKDFFAGLIGVKPNTDAISVVNDNGRWKVTIDDFYDNSKNLREKYGDPRKRLSDVLNAAMNKGHLKVFDIVNKKSVFNEDATRALEGKVKEINDLFNDWLWNQNDERREAMERKYNDEMNNTINPVYNAEFIDDYPGLVRELKGEPFYPKVHQKNVVLKFLTELRGIAAHDAGTGKTLEMAMLCMQLRQTGKAKKPIIFAHNANSAAIAKDFKKYYPGAKVLYVQNVSKSESSDETSIMLSQMTSGDWDAIVLPHSLIDRVAFDEKTVLALRQEEIDYYSQKALDEANAAGIRLTEDDLDIKSNSDDEFDSKGNYLPSKDEKKMYQEQGATSVLDYIKRIKKIRRECHIMGQRLKQPGYIDFTKTGIDCCLIDEAHEFKKGPKATSRQVKGLDTGTSDMGQYMDILTRYIHSIRDNNGVFEFTGTLLTNTIPEIHTHMKYVMPDVLKRAGIYHLDDFLGTFTEASAELEPTETGDYDIVERLRKFINITDLRNIAGQHIDIVTTADMPDFAARKTKSGKDINDKTLTAAERDYLENGRDESARPEGLPNKKVINVIVPSTKRIDFITDRLKRIAKQFKEAKGIDKKAMALAGIPLKLLTLAPSIGASIRNLNPTLKDLNTSKATLCVNNVKQIYDDAQKRGVVASQVIFMEKGYADTKSASMAVTEEVKGGKVARRYTDKFTISGYNMAKDLKGQLIASGIPEEKIAIVGGDNNPYKDPTARSELCDKVKAGEVAVVIAQYGTMGVGANMQDNLRCVHHIDAPWMPGELEQENRRAVRQGNHWNTVREYRYITQGADSKKWSALAAKVSFINAFMDKHSKVRVIESDALGEDTKEGAGDVSQSLAGALGDDRLVQLENKNKKKEQLEKQRRSFENRREEAKRKAKALRDKTIPDLKSKLESVDVDMAVYAHDREVNPDFSIEVRNPSTGEFQTFTDKEKAQSFIDSVVSNRIPDEYQNDMIRFRGFKVGVDYTTDVTGHVVGKYFVARSMKPKAEKQETLLKEDKGEKKAAKPKKEYMDLSTVSDDQYGKAKYIPKQTTINSLQTTLSNLNNSKDKWLQELPKQEELLNTYENQSKAEWKEQQTLNNVNKQIAAIKQDLKDNKVPAPEWFRDRIKVGSIVEHNGNEYTVVGYSAPDGEKVKDYGIIVENPVAGEEERIRIPASEVLYNNERPYTDEELKLDPRQRIEDAADDVNFTPEFKTAADRTLASYFGQQDWSNLLNIHGIERKYQGQKTGKAWTKQIESMGEDSDMQAVTFTPPDIPGSYEGDPGDVDMQPIRQEQKKLQASVAESTVPEIRQSVDQLIDDIKTALPGAKDFHRNGQHLLFIMPNGSSIAVDIANKVILDGKEAEEARKAHGKNADEPIRVNGYTETFGKDAAIKLSQEGDKGTAFHEAFHAAWNIVLSAKEKAAMLKHYEPIAKKLGKNVEEVMADAYRDWQLARKEHKGTIFGKLYQKIKDFAKKALSILAGTDNVHNVMRKVAEGEVWNREGRRNKGTKTDYLVTNEKITGDTKIPVIDVTGLAETDTLDTKVKTALGKTLLNRSFRILGSDGIGFTKKRDRNISDGINKTTYPYKHVIGGTGPEAERTNSVRQKTLTAAQQVLDNAIYIEKHPDMAHKSNVRYVDLYAAVQDGNDIYPIHIIAREKGDNPGLFEVKKAMFYDLKKENPLPTRTSPNRGMAMSRKGFSDISIAELLQNVNDKAGRPYVTNGRLNYEPAAIPALPKGKKQASISSAIDKGFEKAEAYANRNMRATNAETAEGRVGQVFKNTTNKNTPQSVVGWVKEQKNNFYRDFVDKNTALNEIDKAIEATTGKKLASDSKLANAVQIMKALQNGALNTLIEGDEHALNALRERIGDTVDTKNDPEKAERVAELKKRFKAVSMADVMKTIEYKKMDEAHPDYLEKHGLNNWREAFSNYLGARRLLELAKLAKEQGVEYKLPKGVSEADFKAVVDNAPKEFAEAANKFYQLQNNLLVLMEDGNLIGKEVHDYMRKTYHDYCPLMVDFSDTAAFDKVLSRFGNEGNGIANVNNMLKFVLEEGSERGLLSPLESTYKNVAMLTDRAERNKVASKFVQMVENDEDLSKSGILTKIEGMKSDDPKRCIFTVLKNGEKVAYQTTQDLYGPLMTGNENANGMVFSLMRNTARTLRAGATMSPSFIIRNFIRDTIFAGVSSRNGFIPVVDSLRGAWALINDPKLRGEFEAMGVTAFNFYGSMEQAVKSLDELAGGAFEIHSPTDLAKALLRYLGAASEFIEESTRMGEYMKARANGKSMTEAALDAKDVTLDFSRSGRVGQSINKYVPFFNAAIQGGDKMARLLANPETRWHTARMLGMYIMLPSLLLWMYNKDEPWYEEIDPAIKMSSWILPGGIRIPKPQEAGIIFGSGIEAIMDKITDRDPEAMKNWLRVAKENLLPNILPTLFLPLIEWEANYSFFREKPIEGKRLERLPAALRYNNSTSELSKAIGAAGNISPVKLDNTMRGYLGTMGMLAWQIPDLVVGDKRNQPAKRLNEMFFARDFLLNDMNMNRTSEEFYNLVSSAQQKHAGYGKKGKPTQATAAVNKAMRDVSTKNKEIQAIIANRSMTPERKRQLIDKKKKTIHQIQKATLKKYKSKFE